MRRGFSLVETIVTLTLFFVLASMAVQLFSTPYREAARSVRRTADQCRIVEVMEQLVAESLFFQERTPNTLEALSARITAQRYGEDIRITTTSMRYSAAKSLSAEASSELFLLTVEKNGMRLSRVFSN